MIEHLEVMKESAVASNPAYRGEIHITTKAQYSPKFISLTALQSKYAPEAKGFVIFMVDDELVKEDYDLFCVDETNLLTIYIDKVSNAAEGIDIPLIKVLTKSEKNINDRNTIWIRGTAYHKPSGTP
ncbi:hypothetical protein [Parapedobacter sp. DT-150]|uniref:hypothetical protein n=1 Tax=Parapedobacter sp. DT-150 TaxID=3396162 RepID=UPI003F1A2BBC